MGNLPKDLRGMSVLRNIGMHVTVKGSHGPVPPAAAAPSGRHVNAPASGRCWRGRKDVESRRPHLIAPYLYAFGAFSTTYLGPDDGRRAA